MAFQFQCPRGHLLSGEETQAGQQCVCPMCGMLFIIPRPVAIPVYPVMPAHPAVAVPIPPPAPPPIPASSPAAAPVEMEDAPRDRFAALKAAAEEAAATPAVAEAAPETPAAPPEPVLLHIPCPNGHELETPEEMLDQEVLCPHCNAQFVLRRKNSIEYRRKKEEQERMREIKVGNFWLNWAIAAVILVALGLVILIVVRSLSETPVGK